MALSDRFRKLRQYLGLNQVDFGSRIGVQKSHVSDIERGQKRPSLELIEKTVASLSVDARYFFGQIDTPEEADLGLRGDDTNVGQLEALRLEIQDLRSTIQPTAAPKKKAIEMAERIEGYTPLADLFNTVQYWEGGMLRRFTDMAYAYVSGARNEGEKEFLEKKGKAEGERTAG